jgi:hypothetical protein
LFITNRSMENTSALDGLQTAVKVEHRAGEPGQAAVSWWLIFLFFWLSAGHWRRADEATLWNA